MYLGSYVSLFHSVLFSSTLEDFDSVMYSPHPLYVGIKWASLFVSPHGCWVLESYCSVLHIGSTFSYYCFCRCCWSVLHSSTLKVFDSEVYFHILYIIQGSSGLVPVHITLRLLVAREILFGVVLWLSILILLFIFCHSVLGSSALVVIVYLPHLHIIFWAQAGRPVRITPELLGGSFCFFWSSVLVLWKTLIW